MQLSACSFCICLVRSSAEPVGTLSWVNFGLPCFRNDNFLVLSADDNEIKHHYLSLFIFHWKDCGGWKWKNDVKVIYCSGFFFSPQLLSIPSAYFLLTPITLTEEITKLFIAVLKDWCACCTNSEADLQLLQSELTLKPQCWFCSCFLFSWRSFMYELYIFSSPRFLNCLKGISKQKENTE